ncbi:MAG: hypothetical protein WCJ02_04530 [bacterium]
MNFFIKTEQKGSALLVVLGFLTFMIISAVSFSMYMRIERQASSNYKHSITARHLLESALYRAMDEVDADLRGARYKYPGETPPVADAPLTKFPDHWANGRIFASKSNTPEQEKARVLSLEALSCLPASLVNDARVVSASSVEWRRMSMPIEGLVDIENNSARSSGNKSFVGRYAYICVNLSDMLNINGCTVGGRGISNLVSVASLFSATTDPMLASRFSQQCSNDVHYATMQDFYACMAVANQNFFGGPSDSPYIQFLKDGKNLSFNDSYNHLLVADGFAKVPPARSMACNVTLNPPYTKNSKSINTVFYNKIMEIFPEEKGNVNSQQKIFETTLVDYLSSDNVGVSRLDAPSSKLAPMICQVRIDDIVSPTITTEIQGAPPNEITVYNLNMIGDPNALLVGLQVRVCFPFKNVEERIKPYSLSIEGFIRVDKEAREPNLTCRILQGPPPVDTPFTGMATINPPIIDGAGDAQTVQGKCYQWIRPVINIPTTPIKMADSDGQVFNGFDLSKKINLALVITSIKIHRGTIVYDSVSESPLPEDVLPKSKLYFQTKETDIRTVGNFGYLWDSLECPDPRFNHYVVNWLNNSAEPDKNDEFVIHKITKDLLGKEGRDADIFLSSSGAEKLQSIGELGFLVRPYNFDPSKATASINFRDKKGVDPTVDDSDAFFRTIRLYDQAGKTRDKVYENFYMSPDVEGNLPLNANVRINPLTTVGPIIECALDRIPYNFGIENAGSGVQKQNFTEGTFKNGWIPFVEKWANIFTNEVRTVGMKTSLQKTISDFYGDEARMGWYSSEKEARTAIFTGGFAAQAPVYEIDRKMLYAFSLDSMSDRQQLFLYVFQAEAVAPISFAEMRSLAGGRAVALVWRDPYPKGSTIDTPPGLTGSWYDNSASGGTKGYHEQKILFFKQLDN